MLNKLRDKVHQNAVDKGFWDKKPELGTSLMLVVSELAEALEADRDGSKCTALSEPPAFTEDFKLWFRSNVKDTVEDELADTIIRVLDICGAYHIDIQKHIDLKMLYNSKRIKLHGKKY